MVVNDIDEADIESTANKLRELVLGLLEPLTNSKQGCTIPTLVDMGNSGSYLSDSQLDGCVDPTTGHSADHELCSAGGSNGPFPAKSADPGLTSWGQSLTRTFR